MDDRQLARRLDREARQAGKIQLRLVRAHERALRHHGRRVLRARAGLPLRIATAAGSGALALVDVGPDLLWLVSGVAAVAAARAWMVLRTPAPEPPAALAPALHPSGRPARVPPPPGAGSAAFPAVRRLEAARVALARLLPLVAAAGQAAAAEAWRAAGEADLALRWQAARLAAVEPHRGAEPDLLVRLEQGVAAQEALVAAAADLVAASADPLATLRLQDATDTLHGLAAGLREVR